MAFSLTTRRWLVSLATLTALTGCRAIIGVEDFTVAGDGGADGGADSAATFAECVVKCETLNRTGANAFSSSVENCLCNNKLPRTCNPECTNYCDNPGGTVPAQCRACVLGQLSTGGVCANSCQGGGTGACALFVNCVKACPK